jgi:ribosomal protein S18 acetylase RimI-like enzyme
MLAAPVQATDLKHRPKSGVTVDRDLTFRDAQLKDAAGLAEIGRETFAETFGDLYPPGDLRQFLDETYSVSKMEGDLKDPDVEVRIAYSGKRMVAYCKIGPCKLPVDTGPEPSLELHRVYVYQHGQGVGVGRILLAWAIERARQRGARNLFLGVWESNDKAIALYESRGFEKVGAYKFKVGDTIDDEFIMRLRLA